MANFRTHWPCPFPRTCCDQSRQWLIALPMPRGTCGAGARCQQASSYLLRNLEGECNFVSLLCKWTCLSCSSSFLSALLQLLTSSHLQVPLFLPHSEGWNTCSKGILMMGQLGRRLKLWARIGLKGLSANWLLIESPARIILLIKIPIAS